MSKPLSHQLDIYGVWIHLARTRAEWRKLAKSEHLKLDKPTGIGLTQECLRRPGDLHYPVFIDVDKLGARGLVELCAHEATHMAAMFLDSADAQYDGTSEPFAYLVGWVSGWLWKGCTET